jgi:EF hand
MTMNIAASTKSTNAPVGTPDISQLAMRMANGFMNNFDANQDGSLSKDEFVKGMTTKGIPADAATAQFYKIDTKGSGQITKQDLQSAIKNGAFAGGARSGRGGGGGGARVQAPAADSAELSAALQSAAATAAVSEPQLAVAVNEVVEPATVSIEKELINAADEDEELTDSGDDEQPLVYTASPNSAAMQAQSASSKLGNNLDKWV